jgi:hypothetical protein
MRARSTSLAPEGSRPASGASGSGDGSGSGDADRDADTAATAPGGRLHDLQHATHLVRLLDCTTRACCIAASVRASLVNHVVNISARPQPTRHAPCQAVLLRCCEHCHPSVKVRRCSCYAGAKRQRSGPCAPNGRKGSAATGQQPEADAEDSQVTALLAHPSCHASVPDMHDDTLA